MKRPLGFLLRAIEVPGSVFAWTGVSLATVFFTGLIFGLFLIHRWVDPELRAVHRLASLWGMVLVSLTPGAGIRIFGRENLPTDGPVVLMANHQSYTDVPVLFFIRHSFKWMADEDLFKIPFFGWSMRMAGYIRVRRGDRSHARATLVRASRWLAKGISIFVFPEGTRSRTGVLARFRSGGFQLAAETHTPIVPVVVVGTRQLLPRGSWVFRLGVRPEIHILPAIEPTTSELKEVKALARKVKAQMKKKFYQRLHAWRAGKRY